MQADYLLNVMRIWVKQCVSKIFIDFIWTIASRYLLRNCTAMLVLEPSKSLHLACGDISASSPSPESLLTCVIRMHTVEWKWSLTLETVQAHFISPMDFRRHRLEASEMPHPCVMWAAGPRGNKNNPLENCLCVGWRLCSPRILHNSLSSQFHSNQPSWTCGL